MNCEKISLGAAGSYDLARNNLRFESRNVSISNTRNESILNTPNNLTSTPYVTARKVAQIIGKIISTIFVLGNIVRLKTRYLYKSILGQTSWDSYFNVLYYHFTVEEITFWKQNIQTLNKRPLISYKLPITKVYSDASNFWIGTCFEIKGKKYLTQKNISSTKKCRGSTWPELEAIYYSLCSLPKFLNNNSLFWHTDNFAASKIVESGCSKPKMLEKAVKIFDICKVKDLNLEITWISRENNKDADLNSKLIDYDDWILKKSTSKFLKKKWGTMTIDILRNTKIQNALDVIQNIHLIRKINAFSQDWSNEANWLVPPIYLLPKCLTYFALSISGTAGILMLPCCPSATFWPFLVEKKKDL